MKLNEDGSYMIKFPSTCNNSSRCDLEDHIAGNCSYPILSFRSFGHPSLRRDLLFDTQM